MTEDYFKATRLDGFSFRSNYDTAGTAGRVDYGAALGTDAVVKHPMSTEILPNLANTYLSISTQPTGTLIGGRWPCRLFRVEPVGVVVGDLDAHPHKRAVLGVRVIAELPAHLALGPQGEKVVALIERIGRFTVAEAIALCDAARGAARGAARDAAYGAACDAAYGAARGAARGAACDAARDAACDAAYGAARGAAYAAVALLTQDLIHSDTFDALAGPWMNAIPDFPLT